MEKHTDATEIRRIAYRLWLEEGQPEGRDREHWETAKEMWAFQTRNMPTLELAAGAEPRQAGSKAAKRG